MSWKKIFFPSGGVIVISMGRVWFGKLHRAFLFEFGLASCIVFFV